MREVSLERGVVKGTKGSSCGTEFASRWRKYFLKFVLNRLYFNGIALSIPFFIYIKFFTRSKIMVDQEKIKKAVTMILEAIGENPKREGLLETPQRVAKMYSELTAGYDDNAKTHLAKVFTAENAEIVLEKDINFHSLCEHHMLPFFGKVHIAYIPDDKVVGLSKLARVVEVFARRLQIQEQMTNQIADAINDELAPKGVLVIVEAEHTCMTMRGIKKIGSKTVTVSSRGEFTGNLQLQKSVQELIKF